MTIQSKRILITSGDPAGIGPEVILKTLLALQEPGSPPENSIRESFEKSEIRFSLLGSRFVFERLIRKFALALHFEEGVLEPSQRGLGSPACLMGEKGPSVYFDLVDVPVSGKILPPFGKVNRSAGENAFSVLQTSARLIREKRGSAIVTAPVNKEAISLSRPDFIGHTEFYAGAFRVKKFSMAFLSPVFDLVLMTTHLGVRKLSAEMNPGNINLALQNAATLQKITGDKKPILVLGFNPHAGEGGLFGNEDEVIARCISKFKKRFRLVGPLAADSAFVEVVKGKYQTVVACYHDQGLIPLKMLSKGKSVNVTLGLPFVRTSVDHGTAFDIAGTFQAEHGSMVEAISAAVRLVKEKQPSKRFQ